MEVSGVGVEAVIREFSEHRFDRAIGPEEGEPLASADEPFFAELVRGVVDIGIGIHLGFISQKAQISIRN
jgi:N utilization substance protein B